MAIRRYANRRRAHAGLISSRIKSSGSKSIRRIGNAPDSHECDERCVVGKLIQPKACRDAVLIVPRRRIIRGNYARRGPPGPIAVTPRRPGRGFGAERGDGVVAIGSEGMTAAQTRQRHPATGPEPVLAYGIHRVMRAAWRMPTADTECGESGRQGDLVDPQQNQSEPAGDSIFPVRVHAMNGQA